MSIVLTDQTIDQAEAFRLAKSYRLSPKVALNSDPEVIRFAAFCSAYGIDDYPIVIRACRSRLDRGMMTAISGSASYVDRLSHFSDLDRPVSFVDLRQSLTDSVTSSCDYRSGPDSEGRQADHSTTDHVASSSTPGDAGGGGHGGPSAAPTPGPSGPGDQRRAGDGGAPCPRSPYGAYRP